MLNTYARETNPVRLHKQWQYTATTKNQHMLLVTMHQQVKHLSIKLMYVSTFFCSEMNKLSD